MCLAGVLALQGAVEEHMDALARTGWQGVAVKRPEDLAGVEVLIIPGGESTAISRLMLANGLHEAVKAFAASRPIMGTCAGLILLGANMAEGEGDVTPLNLMDSVVRRNGFGRQVDSFEADLDVEGIGSRVPGVFIRAPYIKRLGGSAKALAVFEGRIVMAEQGNVLACSFHPELTEDNRILRYFLAKAG